MGRVVRFGVVVSAVTALCVAAPQVVGASAATPKPVVVVKGLNNPRQIALVSNDELLVAEAGYGGTTKVPGAPGEGDQYVGPTGSISAVYLPQYAHNTTPTRIVRGLLSAAGKDGSAAVGSDGVAARTAHGPIYVQETYAPPDVLPAPFKSKQDGRLLAALPYHAVHVVANITGYEFRHNPDGREKDSNPYAVLARSNDLLVADAAGNDVLRVDSKNRIHVFHVFPNVRSGSCAKQADPGPKFPGCNFVPTSLAVDAAGHVYVGGLVSEARGQGQVLKLSADGRKVLHVYRGFTSVTGVAVSPKGVLYVSELEAKEAHPAGPQVVGVLTRIANGHRRHLDVPFPAGVAVNSKGVVFVAAYSIAPSGGLGGPGTSGQVWKLHF
ncbi:ScyD/ScyE family protein [uncultured Jatrophihabitans sp.]|uniref:ScyD/ScyE family protein n=1 Tax=uncultured Jatrophihabitans sp. TaxID=1610747 RepID=UPI0035CB1111